MIERKRDVGEMGESLLRQWAAEVGITANKVERDRTGWDFLLEFPPEASAVSQDVAFDLRPEPIQCVIQVKATDHRRRRWSVKLSNLVRLAQSPLPAFHLVLEYDGQRECQQCFLIHHDEHLLRRVLHRLRQISADQDPRPLRKIRYQLAYGPEHEIAEPSGIALLDALQSYVGTSLPAYSVQKQKFVRGVGYEDGGAVIDASIIIPAEPGQHPEEALVDFALGLSPDLRVAPGATEWDERFGIRDPRPIRTISTEGRISTRPFQKGALRLRSADGRREVGLDVSAFSAAAVAPLVQKDRLRVRIEAPFLDIEILVNDPAVWKVKLRMPDPENPVLLSELMTLAGLLELLSGEEEIASDLQMGDHWLRGTLEIRGSLSENCRPLIQAIRSAWRVHRRVSFNPEPEPSLEQLWHQRSDLDILAASLEGDTLDATITFCEHPEWIADEEVCVPGLFHAALGDQSVISVAAYTGQARPTETLVEGRREFELKIRQVERHSVRVLAASEITSLDATAMLQSVADAWAETHQVIHWWDQITQTADSGPPQRNSAQS